MKKVLTKNFLIEINAKIHSEQNTNILKTEVCPALA
jgi:hypothetical protein